MIPHLLNHELVDRIGLTLLHFLWQGTLIAVAVAIGNSGLKSTLEEEISSRRGQGISLAYSGPAPDLGAYED